MNVKEVIVPNLLDMPALGVAQVQQAGALRE